MSVYRLAALGLALSFFGAGCFSVDLRPTSIEFPDGIPIVVQPAAEWKTVGPDVEQRIEMVSPSSTARVTLYRFAPSTVDLDFVHSTSVGSIIDWQKAYPDAIAILNGAYFDEESVPAGYFRSEGERIGSRAFDFDKSAFFIGDATPRIIEVKSEAELKNMKSILQSYPLLVQDGQAVVQTDSGKLARRSFVGFDLSKNLYLGIVDGGGISLYELSQYLQRTGVSWTSALNLDGGPSTGLSINVKDLQEVTDSWTLIPNVIIVKKR